MKSSTLKKTIEPNTITNASIHTDERGSLFAIDFKKLPFKPKRVFLVYGMKKNENRGNHAHKKTKQILYCVSGKINVILHGKNNVLNQTITPGKCIFVDKNVWDSITFKQKNSIMLVVSSEYYNQRDYITNLGEFLKTI